MASALAPSDRSEERSQRQEENDGDDLASQDNASGVHRGLPGDVPVLNDVDANGSCLQGHAAAPTPGFVGRSAAETATAGSAHARGWYERDAVLLIRVAKLALDRDRNRLGWAHYCTAAARRYWS